MSELNSLEDLQALYTDLLALSESRLSDLARLGTALDAHVRDFRNLLDKRARSDESRKSLATGILNVSGEEFRINEEFQQGALQLADHLNLDELDAARIFLEVQSETDSSGRSPLTNSIIRFHQRRKVLLDCLRLTLRLSADVDREEHIRASLQALIAQVVQSQNAHSRYIQRCLSSMGDIKSRLQDLAEKLNSASILGQSQQAELLQTIEFERGSLVKQHESLGIVLLYLVKENYSVLADFEWTIDHLRKADKYDNLLLHYFPVLTAYISRFGGMEGGTAMADARAFNDKIFGQVDEKPWALPYVHAAFRAWWLAEYSGWYGESHDGSIPDNQVEDEIRQRSKQFSETLKDGAFDFILALSADVKSVEWQDPARHGLRRWLQRKAPAILADTVPFSDFFQEVLMEQLEVFIEAFITNMPDVLRKLRVDEDEQRQLSKEHEHDLDLEKFIVIISYAFQGRPKAALEGFWDVPDGALIGFMHWASRRASTPLVSAFCEMLQAISEDSECATAAHYFLLDDGPQSSAKMRRTHSLTWNQIFKELTFFSAKIRDRPVLSQAQAYRPGKPHSDLAEAEPESTLMLECYLRLITRLCSESATARTFLAQHSFHITDLLFQLTSSAIEPRLRACAFTTIRSLLSEKTREAGEYLWTALDVWMSGGYSPGSTMPKTASSASVTTSAVSIGAILRSLASGFEEPNAFVQLLQALVSPYADESGLHDSLPFPENLGISSRQPGIDPYIDFALGMVFGKGAAELNDIVQVRLLHLSCLDFIATCLDTFNEDLVIFANQSNIVVDSAIQASSLQTYVLLHPFSRVMEWMYNDKVMDALFTAINQNSADVANSAPNSPLVLCLLRGIHVVTAILDLQPTYLDIIRPLIKLQPNYRRSPVQNAAFSSFEEGVLTHLSIIPNLGHYCGSGHPELVIASLKLLEKLSASPKLASAPSAGLGRGPTRNKILAALDKDADAISKILLGEMESDIDINQGPESSAYITKLQILDFLISCLRANPGRPTIAHLLLGFRCNNDTISVDAEGPFSRGTSLFHTILASVLTANLESDVGISSWLVALSYKGLQVLKELWVSPMSSTLTMTEMRANESFFSLFVRELVIQPGTVFNDLELADPAFISSTSASCLSDFLCRRALILQYLSAELRQVVRGHSPSLKQRIFETLLGSTTDEDGVKFEHATIFDLFDFVEPEFNRTLDPPKFSWFSNIDMYACLDDYYDPSSTYNIPKVEELLVLRKAELVHANRISVQEEPDIISEAQGIILFYAQENQIKILGASRLKLLRAWVQLTLLMIENGEFDSAGKTSFVLRTLQTIMPRLESDLEVIPEAMELARLAKSLIFSLDFSSDAFKQGDMGELVSDRLFHLFQVSLRAINTLGSNVSLKELFYNISYRYLSGMSDVARLSGIHRRHSIQTIKSAGERFIDLVCDDAHASDPTCRIAALLLLGALVKMGKHENSKYIIESLSRLNFIGILVHSIQNIAVDLRETTAEDVNIQLSYCHAKLALLLHISQTRFGAAAVFNAGLFHSVRVSELFATDPDLGVDIQGPDAISKHYDLLAAIMRIICAAVLSRGSQHQQTLEQGRRFLTENRLSILSVLKKSAGLGTGIDMSQQQSVEELADSFMLLMSVTGFLEAEEKTNIKKPVLTSFT